MGLRDFYIRLKGLKLKEVPAHVKPMISLSYVNNALERGLKNYYDKYIDTNSIQPLYHVCFGGLALSYILNLPEERRRHAKHQQHAKEHGDEKH